MKQYFIIPTFIFLLISAGQVRSQGDVARLEFDGKSGEHSFGVIPMDQRGLAVIFETTGFTGDNRKGWEFTFYDNDLKEQWRTLIPVVYGADLQGFDYQGEKLALFFLNTGRIKEGNENFQVTLVNFTDSAFVHTVGSMPDAADFKDFRLSGNTAVAALNLRQSQAAVFFIQLGSAQVDEFLYPREGQSLVEDLRIDPYRNVVNMTVSHYLSRRQDAMYFLELDLHGRQLRETHINPVITGKYLNTATTLTEPGGKVTMIGTYGNFSTRLPVKEDYSGFESAGLFITRIDSAGQQFMNYFNFLELKTLETSFRNRDNLRGMKKRLKDNTEISLNYEMVLHDIDKIGDRYILMAEAYYPEYRTVSDISYDYWGRPITQTYTVFEGYRYFNAVLSAFDEGGNLLWDNNLDMADVTSFNKRRFAGYHFDGEPALLFHVRQGKIAYRVCLEDVEIAGLAFTPVATSEAGDQVMETKEATMEHWFDNAFLCTGRQVIRNNLKPGNERRDVIFINKISLE